jgi:GH24 family phage-related lysozyme (muramidase)
MRNVYLTEEQYVNYVLLEYTKSGLLNESSIDLKKVYQTLYRGCKSFGDFARRTAIIASVGVLSITSLCSVVNRYLPVSQEEKQEIIAQVEAEANKPKIEQLNFKISQDGINHIKKYEKCYLEPYYATRKEKAKGIRTIGWGHKITVNDPQWLKKATSITQEQADVIFEEDIKIYEREMNEVFKSLPKYLQNTDLYPQGFIDACISIIYNSGRRNFKESPVFKTLAKCRIEKDGTINQRDFIYTCSKIKDSCITQGGELLNGLVSRRSAESLMAQN